MKDLREINSAKSTAKILIASSFIILIFGLLFNHLPTIAVAWTVGFYAHGLQWSVIWFYERYHNKP